MAGSTYWQVPQSTRAPSPAPIRQVSNHIPQIHGESSSKSCIRSPHLFTSSSFPRHVVLPPYPTCLLQHRASRGLLKDTCGVQKHLQVCSSLHDTGGQPTESAPSIDPDSAASSPSTHPAENSNQQLPTQDVPPPSEAPSASTTAAPTPPTQAPISKDNQSYISALDASDLEKESQPWDEEIVKSKGRPTVTSGRTSLVNDSLERVVRDSSSSLVGRPTVTPLREEEAAEDERSDTPKRQKERRKGNQGGKTKKEEGLPVRSQPLSSLEDIIRVVVTSLRASPWFAFSLLLSITGVTLYFSSLPSDVKQPGTSWIMGASVLGLTTSKVVGGTSAVSTVGKAWGTTWRASGGAGVVSFYLRAIFSGKRVRVVEYAAADSPPVEDSGRSISGDAKSSTCSPTTSTASRMSTLTLRSASPKVVCKSIATKHGLSPSQITLYQWISPGFFEVLEADGDLSVLPENGFLVWARPGVQVPLQGPLIPPPRNKQHNPETQMNVDCVALLREIADGPWGAKDEQTLVKLALEGDANLMALYGAFGNGHDPSRFVSYVTKLILGNKDIVSDESIDITHSEQDQT